MQVRVKSEAETLELGVACGYLCAQHGGPKIMIGDPWDEITAAQKALTQKEQEAHLAELEETLCTLLKSHTKTILPNIERLISQLHQIQKEVSAASEPSNISDGFIDKIKALSSIPAVKEAVNKAPHPKRFCRTLFDYVE